MRRDEDLRLLRDCLAGKPGAWERFVRRFAPYLAEVCRRTLARQGRPSGPQEVDDLLQDILLACVDRDMALLRAYRGRASPAAYLGAVAVHRVLKERAEPLDEPAARREAVSTEGNPVAVAEFREILSRLKDEVAKLPPRAQMALGLQADGASLQQIGQILDLSEDATAQLLSRARTELKERLKE